MTTILSPRATAMLAARIVREHGEPLQDATLIRRLGDAGVSPIRAREGLRTALFLGMLERVTVGATLALAVPAGANRNAAPRRRVRTRS